MIQLPSLLYRLAVNLDGRRDTQQLATRLSAELDRGITAEQIAFLVDEKLRPAGIVAAAGTPGGSGTASAQRAKRRSDALLLLRYRVPVVPARVVGGIAAVFRPLFWPPVVIAALTAFVALDVWMVLAGGIGQIVPSAKALIFEPALTLLVLAAVVVCGMFHECGHVAACRYGGARPGVMGVGIYLVWPAMYSTVTDAYRLSRAGRLRTDLGGIYFNIIFIAGMSLVYLQSGAPWLLVAIVLLHVETAWQFLPNIRLDGYYILADLVGVPDLFSLIGPVLRGLLPGRDAHPRVAELKSWTRRVMTVWVLLVIPVLAYFLLAFLVVAPRILPAVGHSLVLLVDAVAAAIRGGQPARATLGVIQVFLLLLPWVGISLILIGYCRRIGRWVLGRWHEARTRTGATAELPAWCSRVAGAVPSVRWFLAAAVPVGLLTGLALAATGKQVATAGEEWTVAAAFAARRDGAGAPIPWPDTVAVHQLAALQVIWPGAEPAAVIDAARWVVVAVGLLGCVLVWPVARRLGLRAPAASTAVVLTGVTTQLLTVHGSVDPGVLAAAWLTLAAGLAGRARGANAVAAAAAGIGLLTAPLAAVGVLAAGALLAVVHLPASGWRPRTARLLGAALGVGALIVAVPAVGSGPWAVSGAGPVSAVALVTVFVALALLVGLGWRRSVRLRPLAAAAAAFGVCAAIPGSHATTALLLVAPVLAVLGAALLDDLVAWRARLSAVSVSALLLGAVVHAVLAAAAPVPGDRTRLSTWVRSELDPSTVLLVDPLVAAQLERDGAAPQRLVTDAAAAPPGALVVVAARPGGAEPPVGEGAEPVLTVTGPGGAPTTVLRPDRGPGTGAEKAAARRLGALLAENRALAPAEPAAEALRHGAVDLRLTTALAGLAAGHRLEVAGFPPVPGEPPTAPRRTALITSVDGAPTATPGAVQLVQRWFAAQRPPYRAATVELAGGVLVVRYTVASPLDSPAG